MDKNMEMRDYLMEIIHSPDYDPQTRLPSEHELAKKFDTTRHSARQVYDTLEEMGLVSTRQGVGRTGIRPAGTIDLEFSKESFTDKMVRQGIDLVTVNLGVERQEDRIDEFRDLGLEGDIYKISRLRILNQTPAAIHNSYLSSQRFPNIAEEGREIKSITAYYESKGVGKRKPDRPSLTVDFPSSHLMQSLSCNSLTPLLILTNMVRDQAGQPIEYTKTIYRSDLFIYKV